MANINDMTATGATARQIDHWTRSGYLLADNANCGVGYRRTWPDTELIVARLMFRLTQSGLSPEVAHTVARGESEIGPGIFVFINPTA